jgi:hypothetical protein
MEAHKARSYQPTEINGSNDCLYPFFDLGRLSIMPIAVQRAAIATQMSLTRTNCYNTTLRAGTGPVSRCARSARGSHKVSKWGTKNDAEALGELATRDDGICKASIYVDYNNLIAPLFN